MSFPEFNVFYSITISALTFIIKLLKRACLETGSVFPPFPVLEPLLPEISAVICVWVAVFGHHHPVGKLPPRQSLHGFLGVKN